MKSTIILYHLASSRISMTTEETKITPLEAVMLASRPGILQLCETLSSILPGAVIMRKGYDFTAIFPKMAWVGSYTLLEGTHMITIRKFSRRSRRIRLRATDTFGTFADTALFMREIVKCGQTSHKRKRKAANIEGEVTGITARARLAEPITDTMRISDLRAVALVGL